MGFGERAEPVICTISLATCLAREILFFLLLLDPILRIQFYIECDKIDKCF